MATGGRHPDFPIDWDDLFGRIGDEEIIVEFAISFLRNGEKLMASLSEVISARDAEQIELFAHALKGSASNIGAIPLAKAAWQIEKNVVDNHLDEAASWFEKVIPEYEKLSTLLADSDWVARAKEAVQVKTV